MSGPVLHVAGARPNFPKAAPVLRALTERDVPQVLVHTGQHYDKNMSDVFFTELGIPEPDVNLGVGSGSHAVQTAAIMVRLEETFNEVAPSMVVVYGDVNSTVAAALVASKMGIRLAHVEAGLRSFDLTMPEEINRMVTDRLCNLLFVTSPDGIAHLGNEGVAPDKIHFVGNPMIDTLMGHQDLFDPARVADQLGLTEPYVAATLHRPGNVDDPAVVREVVAAVGQVADQVRVVLPLHPRGKAVLRDAGLLGHPRVMVIDPLGYVDFMSLVLGAQAVITDSGGVQEETTVLGVPCLTLRPNTERPITITHGTNELVTAATLPGRVGDVLAAGRPATWPVPPLWDGRAGQRIARILAEQR
jgi:UDP-N-acetylglucosamine 2-epimerase (non-hydrolysing)